MGKNNHLKLAYTPFLREKINNIVPVKRHKHVWKKSSKIIQRLMIASYDIDSVHYKIIFKYDYIYIYILV